MRGASASSSATKLVIGEHQAILGVVEDVGDVVRREARVHGVADRAHAGDGVEDLEMPRGVPGERGDAVAALHAEPAQRVREQAGAAFDAGVIGAARAAIDLARDDLGPRVVRAAWRISDEISSGWRCMKPCIPGLP